MEERNSSYSPRYKVVNQFLESVSY